METDGEALMEKAGRGEGMPQGLRWGMRQGVRRGHETGHDVRTSHRCHTSAEVQSTVVQGAGYSGAGQRQWSGSTVGFKPHFQASDSGLGFKPRIQASDSSLRFRPRIQVRVRASVRIRGKP